MKGTCGICPGTASLRIRPHSQPRRPSRSIPLCRRQACVRAAASVAVTHVADVASHKEQLYSAMEGAAAYSVATIATTAPGRRGLISRKAVPEGDIVFHVPWHNILMVPTSRKGLEFWRNRYLQPFQQAHGKLPVQLLHFLQGPCTA